MPSSNRDSKTKGVPRISEVARRLGAGKITPAIIHGVLTLAVLALMVLIAAIQAQAASETVLYNFCSQPNCIDGANPLAGLTSDGAGNFYGTTTGGGAFGAGTVFELSPNGSGGWNETVLYSFSGGPDGGNPMAPVIFDRVGNLFGATELGGASGRYGVVYELSPAGASWTEAVLYNFVDYSESGIDTTAGLMMDPAGNLYGINMGAVFELSPSGGGWTFQVLHGNVEGFFAGLTMDAAGHIFGVTAPTGRQSPKLFMLTLYGGVWTWQVLHGFGSNQDPGGTLAIVPYGGTEILCGTTVLGPGKKQGMVYMIYFGKEKNIYTFKGGTDGSNPAGGVVYNANGMLSGTTRVGGDYSEGTVFQIPVFGKKVQVLWSFNGTDGAYPYGNLLLDGTGNLYGTTHLGGSNGAGVVFGVTP